jgi:hypothetical protein
VPDGELRSAIFNVVTSEDLAKSLNQVDSLVRPPEDAYYRELADSYRRVRQALTFIDDETSAGVPRRS